MYLCRKKVNPMKKILLSAILALSAAGAWAQSDSTAFRGYLENTEFGIYLRINFYDKDIQIPGQDYYGPLPGYLGKVNNPFCWVFVEAEVKSPHEARLTVINDYGSEDLQATLTRDNDSIYTLRQGSGSTIKVPRDNKWFKLPRNIEFRRVNGC